MTPYTWDIGLSQTGNPQNTPENNILGGFDIAVWLSKSFVLRRCRSYIFGNWSVAI